MYSIVLVAAFLPMVARFEVLRSNPVAILMAPTRRLRIQAWAAAACTVPFPLLVALPGKYGSSGWTDRLVDQLGYELGTTEITAAMTVLVAMLPTGALLGLPALWNARRTGPARTATTCALLTA